MTREKPAEAIRSHLREAPPTRARPAPSSVASRGLASPQLAPPQVSKDPGQRWDLGRPKATPPLEKAESKGGLFPHQVVPPPSPSLGLEGRAPPLLLAWDWGRKRKVRSLCVFSPRR